MNAAMDPGRYSKPAIALHWLMAVLLVVQFGMGWMMIDLPKKTPAVAFWYGLHKSFGLVAFALLLLRLWWRSRVAPPEYGAHDSALFARAARAAHLALYACMFATPLCGYLASAFGKHAVKFFGIALPQFFHEDAVLQALFRQMHWAFSWLMAALVALHLAAVAYHVACSGTRFVRRMSPL